MQMKIGARYRSQVCDTQLIVVRALPGDVELTIGGHPAIDLAADPEPGLAAEPGSGEGTALGKRYTDAGGKLELLITKAGAGDLALDGEPLRLKEAKPLPASD
jgi:hypothetical protein